MLGGGSGRRGVARVLSWGTSIEVKVCAEKDTVLGAIPTTLERQGSESQYRTINSTIVYREYIREPPHSLSVRGPLPEA